MQWREMEVETAAVDRCERWLLLSRADRVMCRSLELA